MSQFFPQGKFLIVCFVACSVLFASCFFFFLIVSAEKRGGYLKLRCFLRELFSGQLNHSRDCKTDHSTSPDARHVILRKQLSY